MANKLYEENNIVAIADAIRAKKGESSSTKYTVAEMAAGVASIPTGITPTGSLSITENGTYDVTDKAEAVVNVSGGGGLSGNLTICDYLFYTSNANQQKEIFTNPDNLNQLLNMITAPTNCHDMFNRASSSNVSVLSSVQNWINRVDMANCSNVSSMFTYYGYGRVLSTNYGDFSHWTSFANNANLSGMFSYSSFQKINLSNLDCSNISSISSMFSGCTNLKTLIFGSLNNGYKSSSNTAYTFYNCSALENLVLQGTNILPLTSTTSIQGLKSTCKFYVPDNLVDSYKTATNWSARAAYIFPLSQYVES